MGWTAVQGLKYQLFFGDILMSLRIVTKPKASTICIMHPNQISCVRSVLALPYYLVISGTAFRRKNVHKRDRYSDNKQTEFENDKTVIRIA